MESDLGFQAALSEAKAGFSEGGVPIGACLVSSDGSILGRGHNMRVQKGSATLHVCNTGCTVTKLIMISRMSALPSLTGRDIGFRKHREITCFSLCGRDYVHQLVTV